MRRPTKHSLDIVAYRNSHLCSTLQEIGDKFGVTRERVRQVLSRDGAPTRKWVKKWACVDCGISVNWGAVRCKPCLHKQHYIMVECDQCGKLFERRISNILRYKGNSNYNNTHYFCTKECQGKYSGTHYGFVAHPENSSCKIRLDQDKIMYLYNHGIKVYTIAKTLGYSYTGVDRIVKLMRNK